MLIVHSSVLISLINLEFRNGGTKDCHKKPQNKVISFELRDLEFWNPKEFIYIKPKDSYYLNYCNYLVSCDLIFGRKESSRKLTDY